MGHFDWVELETHEQKEYFKRVADELYAEARRLTVFEHTCNEQAAYILQLEKQISLLQKTLDVLHQNKRRTRKVKVKYIGRL